MNCMQLSFSTMHPEISDVNRSYRPLWLTSTSYEFPSYPLLNPGLSDRIALILYYAHIMDQKKISSDFYRLCKDKFENKCEPTALESSVKTWMKHSIVKLHRRREQIISEAVSTLQTQMICTVSQMLFDVFCNLLGESTRKGPSFDAYATRSKRNVPCVGASIWETLFAGNEILLPNCPHFNDFHAIGWDELFLGFTFKKNNNQFSVSKTHPMQWLKRFWLEFCYQPDPTYSIKSVHHKVNETTESQFISQKHSCNEIDDANSSRYFNDDSSVSSKEDSDSSGSWSCADFADESPYEDSPFRNAPKSAMLEKSNATIEWLQSTSRHFTEWGSDSDDENVVFHDVITEENCHDRGGTKGSLCFVDVDCSDEEDDFEVIFSSGSSPVSSFPTDDFDESSLCYENPCFEDTFSSFSVPSFIKTVNEFWSEEMLEIKDKPRQPSKV